MGFPRRHGVLMFALFWAAVLVVLVYWFERALDNQINPNKAVLLAGQQGEVVLKKNIRGQYLAEGFINSAPVSMIVDTGATFVAIPESLAPDLDVEYTGNTSRISTANGLVIGQDVRLRELQLGSFIFRDVYGVTVPKIETETVLLGMNVLDDLSISVSGDTMRMVPIEIAPE